MMNFREELVLKLVGYAMDRDVGLFNTDGVLNSVGERDAVIADFVTSRADAIEARAFPDLPLTKDTDEADAPLGLAPLPLLPMGVLYRGGQGYYKEAQLESYGLKCLKAQAAFDVGRFGGVRVGEIRKPDAANSYRIAVKATDRSDDVGFEVVAALRQHASVIVVSEESHAIETEDDVAPGIFADLPPLPLSTKFDTLGSPYFSPDQMKEYGTECRNAQEAHDNRAFSRILSERLKSASIVNNTVASNGNPAPSVFKPIHETPAGGVIAEIAAERSRQIIDEGYTPSGDDAYDDEILERAAACYAYPVKPAHIDTPMNWPWSRLNWKPGNRRRMLIKAAALLVAAIERLDRIAAKIAADAGKPKGDAQ